MKGGVYQKKNNMKYYPYIYDKDTQKKKWGTGSSKKADAEKELRKMLNDYDNGSVLFNKSKSFEYVYEQWGEMIAPEVYTTPHSLSTSKGYASRNLLPELKNKSIDKITTLEIQKIFFKMRKRNGDELCSATKRKIMGVANSIFQAAITWGLCTSNPCKNVSIKQDSKKEMVVWSEDDLLHFFEIAKDSKYFLQFFILATTGMRRGEVCALRWGDYSNGALTLRRSMDVSGNITDMKTSSSHRRIDLMQACILAIEQQKVKQATIYKEIKDKSAIGKIQRINDYICTDEWNERVLPERLTIGFRKIILDNNEEDPEDDSKEKKRKLPEIRLHDLRHGFATLALSNGINIKIISDMLGHAKTSTTHNIYANYTASMQQSSVVKIEDAMFKRTNNILSVESVVENG